jgi:hypothetical protein
MNDDEALRKALRGEQSSAPPALDEILTEKVRRYRIRPATIAIVFVVAGAGAYHVHESGSLQGPVTINYPPTTDWLLTSLPPSQVQR